MPRLTAHFEVVLEDVLPADARLLVQRPREDTLEYEFCEDDWTVRIALVPEPEGGFTPAGSPHPIFWLSGVRLQVSRDEPPFAFEDEVQEFSFFFHRVTAYRDFAALSLSRLIGFFKYALGNPFLRLVHPLQFAASERLAFPSWTNEHGQEVPSEKMRQKLKENGPRIYKIPAPHRGLGIRYLDASRDAELADWLVDPKRPELHPELYEEILSDAKAAILEGNIRRGVLELAVACEILVKRAFFGEGTPAGGTFDSLERKRLVEVKVLELISGAAQEAFDESFKKLDPENFKRIDHLFRCRNKIAHRGAAQFRDDAAVLHDVDRATAEEWWSAVEALAVWLKSRIAPPKLPP